jgi:hypothetical protein
VSARGMVVLAFGLVAAATAARADDWAPPTSGVLTAKELEGVERYLESLKKQGGDGDRFYMRQIRPGGVLGPWMRGEETRAIEASGLAPAELDWALTTTLETTWTLVLDGTDQPAFRARAALNRASILREDALRAWREGLHQIAGVTTSSEEIGASFETWRQARAEVAPARAKVRFAAARLEGARAVSDSVADAINKKNGELGRKPGANEESDEERKGGWTVGDAVRKVCQDRIDALVKEKNDLEDTYIDKARAEQNSMRVYLDLYEERCGKKVAPELKELEAQRDFAYRQEEMLQALAAGRDADIKKATTDALDRLPKTNVELVKGRASELTSLLVALGQFRFQLGKGR